MKMSYKTCAVPQCTNTSTKTPSKLFAHVPHATKRRKRWLTLARRNPNESPTLRLYFCEDHFDIKVETSYIKKCIVPKCTNTSMKTKLFIRVPANEMRIKWLELAKRDDAHFLSAISRMFFCEDHFDLPNDMENYMQYHIMGSVSQVRMKPGCEPTKFFCQSDWRKRTSNSRTTRKRASDSKTRRKRTSNSTTKRLYMARKDELKWRMEIIKDIVNSFGEKKIITEKLSIEETALDVFVKSEPDESDLDVIKTEIKEEPEDYYEYGTDIEDVFVKSEPDESDLVPFT